MVVLAIGGACTLAAINQWTEPSYSYESDFNNWTISGNNASFHWRFPVKTRAIFMGNTPAKTKTILLADKRHLGPNRSRYPLKISIPQDLRDRHDNEGFL
jgi:hypothetical protein